MKMSKWKLSGWVFGAIVAVSLLIYLWNYVSPEFAKFVGYLIGGVLAICQIVISNRRATAAEKTAASMEKGNVAERFKNAIEHLGYESVSVRLGGIYALHHIAQDEVNYRVRVFEILCAHIRETTVDESYKQRSSVPGGAYNMPTVEIQSILDLLFVSETGKKIYKGIQANLQGADLQGAVLGYANLEKALLLGADLHGATLMSANLKEAAIYSVDLKYTTFFDADLEGAGIALPRNFHFEQLMHVKTLYRAVIPNDMEAKIKEQKPELFEKPTDET